MLVLTNLLQTIVLPEPKKMYVHHSKIDIKNNNNLIRTLVKLGSDIRTCSEDSGKGKTLGCTITC